MLQKVMPMNGSLHERGLAEKVSRFSTSVVAGGLPTETRHIVVVPVGDELAAGFAVALEIAAAGETVRIVGTGATLRSFWPDSLTTTSPAIAGRILTTELGAYCIGARVETTRELQRSVEGWLDAIFEDVFVGLRGSDVFYPAAMLRFLQATLEAVHVARGLAAAHPTSTFRSVNADWPGLSILDHLVGRTGGRVISGPRRVLQPPWPVEFGAWCALTLGGTVAEVARSYAQARPSRRRLARLRAERTATEEPTVWVSVIPDLPRASRHTLDVVLKPELTRSGRPAVLLYGSLGPGARSEANLRRREQLPLWPALEPFRKALADSIVDQGVAPENLTEAITGLARATKRSAVVVSRLLLRPDREGSGLGLFELRPHARELSRLVVLEVVRSTFAEVATRALIGRQRFEGKVVVLPGASSPDAVVMDLLLQQAGATTVEFSHGSLGDDWAGAPQSRTSARCVWTLVDAASITALGQACIVTGAPREIAVPQPRGRSAERRRLRVLILSNYAHPGLRVGGRWPFEPYLRELARVPGVLRGTRASLAIRWRPHPAEDRSIVMRAIDAVPDIELSKNAALADDLAWCDVVITSLSAAIVEALGADVPVFVHLPPEFRDAPTGRFLSPTRTFFRAEDIVPSFSDYLDAAQRDDLERLDAERTARVKLFGPTGKPAPMPDLRNVDAIRTAALPADGVRSAPVVTATPPAWARPPTRLKSFAQRQLRVRVPPWLSSALSNCGGTNSALGRFAGGVADATISEEEFTAICHSLIFPNGVRKTTKRGRNTALFRDLVDCGALTLPAAARVLDVGASGGLDALATVDLLSQRGEVTKYVLGDLYTCVLYDRERGLVFDEDHNLLQVRRDRSFVSVNFSYNFDFQRLTNLPKRIRPWLLRRQYAYEPGPSVVRLPLAHRQLAIDSPGSPFQLRRMNVFEPVADEFDLVICMHLLVARYFAPQEIEAGIRNLSAALAVGGSLVVGATEDFRVIRRVGTSELEERRFP